MLIERLYNLSEILFSLAIVLGRSTTVASESIIFIRYLQFYSLRFAKYTSQHYLKILNII